MNVYVGENLPVSSTDLLGFELEF